MGGGEEVPESFEDGTMCNINDKTTYKLSM